MPEAVKELADKIGLGDPETALEGLAKDGRLRPDSSGKRSRPVRIAKKQVRAYYFVGVLPEEEQEAGTRQGVPAACSTARSSTNPVRRIRPPPVCPHWSRRSFVKLR
jgi:hypothetical protein